LIGCEYFVFDFVNDFGYYGLCDGEIHGGAVYIHVVIVSPIAFVLVYFFFE
jgi:hypothetical protein